MTYELCRCAAVRPSGYQRDLNEFIDILKRNSYPLHFINQVIKTYNKDTNSNTTNNEQDHTQAKPQIHYFKLPYIGHYSQITKRKLHNLVRRYCTNLAIKLVLPSFKIKNFFRFEDPIPFLLKSNGVYKFSCAGCNSRYIGETSRHLNISVSW